MGACCLPKLEVGAHFRPSPEGGERSRKEPSHFESPHSCLILSQEVGSGPGPGPTQLPPLLRGKLWWEHFSLGRKWAGNDIVSPPVCKSSCKTNDFAGKRILFLPEHFPWCLGELVGQGQSNYSGSAWPLTHILQEPAEWCREERPVGWKAPGLAAEQ